MFHLLTMKKILIVIGCLFLTAIVLVTARYFVKNTRLPSSNYSAFSSSLQCTMAGRPCWEIIRLTFNETQTLEPTEEIKRTTKNWQDKIEYKNNSLETLGLSVIRHEYYRDGGSERYILSNGAHLFMDGKIDSPNRWQTTLSFPDGKKFVFNEQGKLVEQTNLP